MATALAVACAPALAADTSLSGPSGLLTVPTAHVIDEGRASFGATRHNPRPDVLDDVGNWLFSVGFLPGLELGGRIADSLEPGTIDVRDLSFHAKYAITPWQGGPAFAVGGQDIGGAAQLFRSYYAVATLPLWQFNLTAGYGWGPQILEGPLGGIELNVFPFLSLLGEYDGSDTKGGVRLRSGDLLGPVSAAFTAASRGATDEIEYGLSLTFPLGRSVTRVPDVNVGAAHGRDRPSETPRDLRATLKTLGYESIRIGQRPDTTEVVTLENRRYNHSSADAIGLALGVIAQHAADASRVELTLSAYGVPQITVATAAADYRAFLGDAAQVPELQIHYADGPANPHDIQWDGTPAEPLRAVEVVLEPALRTFVATEHGLIDYSLAARLRGTVPLARGLIGHVGVVVPVARSDDFDAGDSFEGFAPDAGVDLALLQYAHKPTRQWTWLWSAGLLELFQIDYAVAALEQHWTADTGAHRLHAKVMALQASNNTREIALAGYTYFDAARAFSVGLTGGRFHEGDSGFRVELNRHFGDTIAGVFFKAASRDDQAVGFQVSLPLTPRQDAHPSGVQLKGPRRWGHSLSSTINAQGAMNPLRPLLLYEPQLDFDLRRDFQDSGRLGPGYLRAQLPRMHEAYHAFAALPTSGD